ncbi:hypothetical protein HANVADRAFT_52447 [Hanseniaspora valbyensis NRRL Y-1626]|uniref:Uncharacterized protein n=1 Tax=Hanseniaspora valbyensis NRRL Y-1626 TaxID=766949 RepID=A0A1B7TEP3_9ASCO|nr:hypothetical protein HANVADRAFT_52447 [Hanseniaspora valbyensis NRRL Y-1626]
MFKKQPSFKTSNNIKSSDLKKLNKEIVSTVLLQEELPSLASDEFTLDSKSVQKTQFESTVSKGLVYSINLTSKENNNTLRVPSWVEVTQLSSDYKLFQFNKSLKNKIKLFPTVYTTWLYENLIPVVITNSYVLDEVIMINGSDLSIRGCALPNQYENFYNTPEYVQKLTKGTIVGIADFKQPKFIKAVGVLMEDADKTGETGMIVSVLHTWNDFLKTNFKVTFEPPSNVKAFEENEETETPDMEKLDINEVTSDEEQQQEKEGEETEPETSALTPKEVDGYLYMSLYYMITQKIKIEFPCTGSNFISQFILKYLPYDSPVDQIKLKNSSFKKSAKLFKAWEKESLIKCKTLKSGDVQILAILTDPSKVKDNENLRCFITYKTLAESNSKKNNGNSSEENIDFINAEILYKPKSGEASRLVMHVEEKDYLNKTQIKEASEKYITENNLVNTKNKRQIIVDQCLAKLLKCEENSIIDRKDVSTKILANSSAFNFCLQIYKGSNYKGPIYQQPIKTSLMSSTGSQTDIPPIFVKQESFRNKIITRISNLWVYNIDLEQLADVLKLKCNASVTFDELKLPTLPCVVNNFEDSQDPFKITSFTKLQVQKTDILVQGPHEKLILSILKKNNKININSPSYVKTKNDIKGRRKNASST